MLDIQRAKASKIVQSNALVRSKQSFSMMQRRLFYLAMKAVTRSDIEFRELIIPEPYLRELMSADYGSFRTKLYDAANGLVGTTISIHRASGSWAHISVFQTIEYLGPGEASESGYQNSQNYPVVRMKLHEDLKAYLLKLEKGYNSQPLMYVLNFRNARAHKLFELLLHDSWAGERVQVTFNREDLEVYLDVDKKGYKKFRDLRRVLDRLQNEIEEITAMRLEYEGKRVGRSIGQLTFRVDMSGRVRQPRLGEMENSDEEIETLQLANELRELHFKQDPYQFIKEHGLDAVRKAVETTRAAIKQNQGTRNPIHNPGGFITFLLKNAASLEHEASEADLDKAKVRELVDGLRETYDQELISYCATVYDSFSSEERNHLLQLMHATLSKFEIKALDGSDWRGTVFEGCRNRVMITQGLAMLPPALTTVAGFLTKQALDVTSAELQNIATCLADELQLPLDQTELV